MNSTWWAVGIGGSLLFLSPCAQCENPGGQGVGTYVTQLKSGDADVRVEALRGLMTSLDPRLPELFLPLLADEGNSVRRLAARAVGSRWWQIPDDRVPAYLSALRRNAKSEFEDEQNMVQRAVGLLTRRYEGDMFARSADGRWVVYERYGLPCLIDTTTKTEELLGWSPGETASLASSWGNSKTSDSVYWNARKDAVAFFIYLAKKISTVWIWRQGSGLRKITPEEIMEALGLREKDLVMGAGFYAGVQGWKGDDLLIELMYYKMKGDELSEHSATVMWDAATNKLRPVSRKAAGG